MLPSKPLRELRKVDNTPITDMNSDWVTMAYNFDHHNILAIQMRWSDINLRGVLYIDYSNETCLETGSNIPDADWAPFSAINLDGTFQSILHLDAELGVNSFRLRFDNVSGTANIDKVFINRKRSW